jgi:deoxycytidylate deaminase
MNTNRDPKELVVALLNRSQCAVQVAAVLEDVNGVHAWGWNSSGRDGYGQHAEAHCLSRANPRRLAGSILYVAARRRRNGRVVQSRPCETCQKVIWRVTRVVYRDGNGVWCG